MKLATRAKEQYGPDDPRHAASLSALCMLHRLRWERTRSREALDEAVGYGRAAVEVSPPGDPLLVRHMSSLATALQEVFDAGGEMAVIEEAIMLYRGCLDLIEHDDDEYAGQQSNLANSLLRRAQREPDPLVQDEAIRYARAALRATPPDSPGYPIRLVNLGGTLAALANSAQGVDQARSMLDEAQSLWERALRRFPPGHPARGRLQDSLMTIQMVRLTLGD
ncbi:hypothetical protein ACTIVE_0771 [Actinomadura verrucosospora]|uniref:Tetratricopeptide repeat protein n=1 Tax=Actinomadura verrucosospora TaxID=46165 RepID=A0A7D3VP01_ACTVE|nr:hypothetical protein ACTIVE_0771 [Actinomadura verrucosospora]